jgi:hypothetical protein
MLSELSLVIGPIMLVHVHQLPRRDFRPPLRLALDPDRLVSHRVKEPGAALNLVIDDAHVRHPVRAERPFPDRDVVPALPADQRGTLRTLPGAALGLFTCA